MSSSPRQPTFPLSARRSSSSSFRSQSSAHQSLSIPPVPSPALPSQYSPNLGGGSPSLPQGFPGMQRGVSSTSGRSFSAGGGGGGALEGDDIDKLGYQYSLRVALLLQHISNPPPPLPRGASPYSSPPLASPPLHGTSPNGSRFSFSALSTSSPSPSSYPQPPSPTFSNNSADPGTPTTPGTGGTPRQPTRRKSSFFSKNESEGNKLPKEFLIEFWGVLASSKGEVGWDTAVTQFLTLIGSGKKGTKTPSGLNLREIPTFLEAFTSVLPPASRSSAPPHIHQTNLLQLVYKSLPNCTYFSPLARSQSEKDRDLLFKLRAEVQSYMLPGSGTSIASGGGRGGSDSPDLTAGLGMGMRNDTGSRSSSPGGRKPPPSLALGRSLSHHSDDGRGGGLVNDVAVIWGVSLDIIDRDSFAIKRQGLEKIYLTELKRSLSSLSSLPQPTPTQRQKQINLSNQLSKLLTSFPELSTPTSPGGYTTPDLTSPTSTTEFFSPPKKIQVFQRLQTRSNAVGKGSELVDRCREMWGVAGKRDLERELETLIPRWESSLDTPQEVEWGRKLSDTLSDYSSLLSPTDQIPSPITNLSTNILTIILSTLPNIFPTNPTPPPGPPASILPILKSAPGIFLTPGNKKKIDEMGDELRAGAVGEYVAAAGEFMGGVGGGDGGGGFGESGGKDEVIDGFEGLIKWMEREIKNIRKVWGDGIPGILDPAGIVLSKQLPLYLAELQVLDKPRAKGSDIFGLYEIVARILEVWEEICPGQEHGFDLDQFFEPHVQAWLKDTEETNTHEWVSRAVGMDSWVPEGENKHSQSVIDLFAFIREAVQVVLHDLPLGEYKRALYIVDLAKTISNAVAQYASTVQALFTTDLTPIKASTPTSELQNKLQSQLGGKASAWLAKGKQAVNNLEKKKVEGFVIPPVACVKLTDMGAAQISLEDLVFAMEAEETAEILKSHNVNTKSSSVEKGRNVFSVTIMRGENLLAKNLTKAADAFVVILDKESGERVLKTRTVLGAEDPRWEESFEVTVGTLKTLELTCYDRLLVGKHDPIGSATFRLDPKMFTSITTRDVLLPLTPRGMIRLRVSMAGGQQHDVHSHLLTAHRVLERAAMDMQRDILDRMGEFIKHNLSLGTLQALTRPLKDKKNRKVALTEQDLEASLWPLFEYFNENFSVFSVTLLVDQRLSLMLQIWRRLIDTLISLLVPPLSDKPIPASYSTNQITPQEIDVIFKWLQLFKSFFNAKEADGIEHGVPLSQLQSGPYKDIIVLGQYMDLPTPALKERVSAAVKVAGRVSGATAGMRGLNINTGAGPKTGEDEEERLAEVLLRITRTRPDTGEFLGHQISLLTRARMDRQGGII